MLLGNALPLITLFALGALTFEQFALPLLPWATLAVMAFFSMRLWREGERALLLALAATLGGLTSKGLAFPGFPLGFCLIALLLLIGGGVLGLYAVKAPLQAPGSVGAASQDKDP